MACILYNVNMIKFYNINEVSEILLYSISARTISFPLIFLQLPRWIMQMMGHAKMQELLHCIRYTLIHVFSYTRLILPYT